MMDATANKMHIKGKEQNAIVGDTRVLIEESWPGDVTTVIDHLTDNGWVEIMRNKTVSGLPKGAVVHYPDGSEWIVISENGKHGFTLNKTSHE